MAAINGCAAKIYSGPTIGSGRDFQNVAAQPIKQRGIENVINELECLRKRYGEILGRLSNTNSRLSGESLASGEAAGNPQPPGAVGTLLSLIGNLNAIASEIENEVNRLEQFA